MNRSLSRVGMALGWMLLVILTVRFADGAAALWRRQQEALTEAQERLMRLKGWIAVEPEVTRRRDEVFGPFSHLARSDYSWAALQSLEQAAKEKEMMVTELRPSWILGKGGQPAGLRLDAKMEGGLSQLSRLLLRLPEVMPGLQLENLQIMPQGGNRIQALLRIRLAGPGSSEG
ncbi:MAG: hypothetical protein HYZ93_02860 [Candidatus Omnitrophica bacterium]|nr:hypothetical protein [Candidatus Omnitrophota bacterium]